MGGAVAQLLRGSIITLLGSLGVLAVIQLLPWLSGGIQGWLGLDVPSWAGPIAHAARPVATRLVSEVDPADYEQLLVAGVTIAATLLGIYYATVGLVIGSVYAPASPQTRQAFLKNRASRAYSWTSVATVVMDLQLLAFRTMHIRPRGLSLLLIAVMAASVVVALVRLGVRLLDFFEPASLLTTSTRDFEAWLKAAEKRARKSPSAPFLEVCRIEAGSILSLMHSVVELVAVKSNHGGGQASFASEGERYTYRTIMGLWGSYAKVKPFLPLESGWFPKSVEEPDWLQTDSQHLLIAMNARSPVSGTARVDRHWAERSLAESLSQLLSALPPRAAADLMDSGPDLTRYLASMGMFEEAQIWLETVQSACSKKLTPPQTESGEATGSVALASWAGLAQVNASLGLRDYCALLRGGFPSWMDDEVDGRTRRPLGHRSRKLVVAIKQALESEAWVEGEIITPRFVYRQLIARDVATEIMDQLEVLRQSLEVQYVAWLDSLTTVAPPEVQAAALTRLDEAVAKFSLTIDAAEALLTECEAIHRDTDDRWPSTDLKDVREAENRLATEVGRRMAIVLPTLKTRRSELVPDFFGWFFQRLMFAVHGQVVKGETESLGKMVPALFEAAQKANSRLALTVPRNHPTVRAVHIIDPIVSFCELSGVALLYSKINASEDLFKPFDRAWRGAASSGGAVAIQTIYDIVNLERSTLLGFTNPALVRSARDSGVAQDLRQRGIKADRWDPRAKPNWVERYAYLASHHHFSSAFAAAYLGELAKELGIQGVTVPERLKPLASELSVSLTEPKDHQPSKSKGGA